MGLTWNEVETRIRRAEKAMETGNYKVIKGQSPKTFHVINGDPQQTTPYVVTFDNATGACTCPDYANRGGPACKHTALVVLSQWPDAFERWKQKVEALCEEEQTHAPPEAPDLEGVIRFAVENQAQHHLAQFVAQLRQLADSLEAEIAAIVLDSASPNQG